MEVKVLTDKETIRVLQDRISELEEIIRLYERRLEVIGDALKSAEEK